MDYSQIIGPSVFAFILLALAIFIIDRDYRVKKNGKKARGTVIDIEEEVSRDSDGETTLYHLLIKFKNSKGNEIIKRSDFSSSIPTSRKPPYKIPIFYLKEDNDYIIVLAKNNIKMIFAYTLLTLAILILTFVLLYASDKLETIQNYILNIYS